MEFLKNALVFETKKMIKNLSWEVEKFSAVYPTPVENVEINRNIVLFAILEISVPKLYQVQGTQKTENCSNNLNTDVVSGATETSKMDFEISRVFSGTSSTV